MEGLDAERLRGTIRADPWITNSFLDSCAFDPKYDPEDKAAAAIFTLHKEENLSIILAHSIQKEVDHPNTPTWVKAEASRLIFTSPVPSTPSEKACYENILRVLAGQGSPKNVEQDAQHIFEAQKYGSYFVTTDRRLLKCAVTIRALCPVEILLPSRFLELVQRYRQTGRVQRSP